MTLEAGYGLLIVSVGPLALAGKHAEPLPCALATAVDKLLVGISIATSVAISRAIGHIASLAGVSV